MREEKVQFPDGMRVAVCISGMPTNYKTAFKYQNKNLFEVLKPDIFLHSWYEQSDAELDELVDLYKPKSYALELNNQIRLRRDEKGYRGTSPRYKAYNLFSFFKSVYEANKTKCYWEKMNGFTYDWVIRLRFDYAVNRTFELKYYKNDYLYIPNELEDRKMVTDQFAFGNSRNMNVYSGMYHSLDMYHDEGEIMIGEHMLTENLRRNDLLDKVVYLDMNHPFAPQGGDSMRNSLVRQYNVEE